MASVVVKLNRFVLLIILLTAHMYAAAVNPDFTAAAGRLMIVDLWLTAPKGATPVN